MKTKFVYLIAIILGLVAGALLGVIIPLYLPIYPEDESFIMLLLLPETVLGGAIFGSILGFVIARLIIRKSKNNN